jgi:hypothetical protein
LVDRGILRTEDETAGRRDEEDRSRTASSSQGFHIAVLGKLPNNSKEKRKLAAGDVHC